jgi:hypothetical protein
MPSGMGARCGRASALTKGFEPGEHVFELLVMFQQHGHDDDLERPWPRQIDPGLDVPLGAVEEAIERGLIALA